MMWRDGVVEQLHSTWGGCAMVWVRIEAAPANARVYLPGEKVKALLYTDLFGQARLVNGCVLRFLPWLAHLVQVGTPWLGPV